MASEIQPTPASHDTEKVEIVKPDEVRHDVVIKSPFEDLGPWKTAKVFRKATMMALFAAFSACADGYQIAMTNTIIANRGFINQFGTKTNAAGQTILDPAVLALWGGIGSMGQGLGMITMHFIADRFGRKKAFYCIWTVLLAAVFCETFGRSWHVWAVAKVFSMYAVGSVQFLTGTYVTEISPSRIRGFLLLFYSVWYGLGQLFASVALKTLADRHPTDYLTLIYTEYVTLGVMLFVYCIIPESPYWCASHDQHERGRRTIQSLHGGIKDYDVDFHYQLIRNTVELEKLQAREIMGEAKPFWKDVWDTKEIFIGVNGFRTLVAFMPAAFQQLSGLAVLSSYASYFAQQAGFADPFTFSLLLAMIGLVITIIGAFILDWVGRRSMFLCSVAATWVFLMTIGGIGLTSNRSYSLNQFVLFVALMWRAVQTLVGDLGWSYVAETGSSRLRAKTAGFAAAGGVCIGLVFSTSVPYMISASAANWGLKTCFFFAGVSAPLAIASWFIMPDTSRRTPAELDEMFEKKIRPWRFRSYVTEAQKALQVERELAGTSDVAAVQNMAAARRTQDE